MRTQPLFTTVALFGVLVAASGCDRGATEPASAELSSNEISALAPQIDALAFAMTSLIVPQAVDRAFSHTVPCPKGGTTTLARQVTGQVDREARTATTEMKATKTDQNCAFVAGRSGVTVTVNGNPNIVLQTNRRIVNGALSGPQISTQKGSFTWARSNGTSGSCTVDLTSTLDPATRSHTLTGSMCDRQINVVHGRS